MNARTVLAGLCAVTFVGVFAAMALALARHRSGRGGAHGGRRDGSEGSDPAPPFHRSALAEWLWAAVPVAIVLAALLPALHMLRARGGAAGAAAEPVAARANPGAAGVTDAASTAVAPSSAAGATPPPKPAPH